jgi:hypothetical protein
MLNYLDTIFLLLLKRITQGAIVLFLLLSLFSSIKAQNIEEYALKEVMIFKITTLIEWPEDSKVCSANEPVVISIIGENPFKGQLKKLADSDYRKIKKKQAIVRYIQNPEEIADSDILFISSSERYDISKILKYIQNKPILTIGDTKGYVEKGVMIEFALYSGKMRIKINKKQADKSKIYINSQLLGNAFKVVR